MCVWSRLAFVCVHCLLIPVKEQQKVGSGSPLLDVGTQSRVATGAAGTVLEVFSWDPVLVKEPTRCPQETRARQPLPLSLLCPPGTEPHPGLALPVGLSAGRSPGTSPRGSALGAEKDSFLGDGRSGICPLHLSRWELARQSCGGRLWLAEARIGGAS